MLFFILPDVGVTAEVLDALPFFFFFVLRLFMKPNYSMVYIFESFPVYERELEELKTK